MITPKQTRRRYTNADLARLEGEYRQAVERNTLPALAASMGRSVKNICDKAGTLGLTDSSRHPRGFTGKRHTEAARSKSKDASDAFWSSLSAAEKTEQVNSALKSAIAKNGRIGPKVPNRSTTWKAGWREIGNCKKYYRSRWEANYARYLQWLFNKGEILDWKHEPETFWFDGIKRGVRSYLPDFRVWELDGSSKLHEVKGWMDARSKTTLKRMAKYHPTETIIVVREKEYKAIERTVSRMIEGWES